MALMQKLWRQTSSYRAADADAGYSIASLAAYRLFKQVVPVPARTMRQGNMSITRSPLTPLCLRVAQMRPTAARDTVSR